MVTMCWSMFPTPGAADTSLTEGEIFGRYGGEEFVVLFPGKTPAEALPTVQALGKRMRTHAWSHGKPVTISGGLSGYVGGISYSDFIKTADENLYHFKRRTGQDGLSLILSQAIFCLINNDFTVRVLVSGLFVDYCSFCYNTGFIRVTKPTTLGMCIYYE